MPRCLVEVVARVIFQCAPWRPTCEARREASGSGTSTRHADTLTCRFVLTELNF